MTGDKRGFKDKLVNFWLAALFTLARRMPEALEFIKPGIAFFVPLFSKKIRTNTRLNAERLGIPATAAFTRGVVASFYQFIIDIGRSSGASADELRMEVREIDGHDRFVALRQHGRGAVIVTAHMGSFEIGLAALTRVEKSIHVVFKRDAFGGFDQMRTAMRQRMGIHEAPIDDGWPALIRLRDALANNEVIVMQADRAFPGQKSAAVKIGRGTLRIPQGPVTLARINGSPIVPVFTVRQPDGTYKLCIANAIDPSADDAIEQIGKVIETFVMKHPEQWLVLEAAFVEDAVRG